MKRKAINVARNARTKAMKRKAIFLRQLAAWGITEEMYNEMQARKALMEAEIGQKLAAFGGKK